MRSRVMPKWRPISSSVFGSSPREAVAQLEHLALAVAELLERLHDLLAAELAVRRLRRDGRARRPR